MSEQKNAQRIFDKGQILYRELGAKHKEDKAFLLMLSLMSSEETSQKLQADFYATSHKSDNQSFAVRYGRSENHQNVGF